MLRESTNAKLPEDALPPREPPTHESMMEERLDMIVEYLRRAEKRDRMRMAGGTIRSILSVIPLIILLGGTWYVTSHFADILKMMSAEAAKQAAAYSQQSASGFLDQLKGLVPK